MIVIFLLLSNFMGKTYKDSKPAILSRKESPARKPKMEPYRRKEK